MFPLFIFLDKSVRFSSGRDGRIWDRVNRKKRDDKIVCNYEWGEFMSRRRERESNKDLHVHEGF